MSSLLKYIELASNQLTECVTGNGPLGLLSSSQKDEVLWFSKIAWNIALEAGGYYKEMMKAFDTCQKVCVLTQLFYFTFLFVFFFFLSAVSLIASRYFNC